MAPALCATAKQLEKEMKKDTVDICVYLKSARRLGHGLDDRPTIQEMEAKGLLSSHLLYVEM